MSDRNPSDRPRFTVDTHLFRELGALLVGRDSTALAELIKNTYDADASTVTITGEGLAEGSGSITVTDDGVGMTIEEFETGFLRIASRSREQGDRRSPRYGRRFTGAKGVGRLSAHKLAARLTVTSTPDLEAKALPAAAGVNATIDWDIIEEHETLEEVGAGISVTSRVVAENDAPGTTIKLERLRRPWTDRALATFLAELEAFRPPPPLIEPLAEGIAAGPLLFSTPRVHSGPRGGGVGDRDPGFDITAAGDFATGEDYWDRVAARSNWVIEVEARRNGVTAIVAPTLRGPLGGPVEPRHFTWRHPTPAIGPYFDARLLVRAGVIGPARDPIADFTRRVAGVRVYMEGFRVLPYGGLGDDWLDLDRDYARRIRELQIPEELGGVEPAESESFKIIPNQGYYGAVFLTSDWAAGLEMVVSREGFLPNESFWTMRTIVRSAIDLSTRVRAAVSTQAAERKAATSSKRPAGVVGQETKTSPTSPHDSHADRVASQLNDARAALARLRDSASASAEDGFDDLDAAINAAADEFDSLMSTQSTLRILASVGQQLAEFVHETNGMLALARQINSLLRDNAGQPTEQSIRSATESADRLVSLIDRQASYLVEVLSPDSRRRRSRRQLARAVQAAAQLVASRAEHRNLQVRIHVPATLTTVPMFGAELTTVFTNLLTNAVKAADADGSIEVAGSTEGATTVVTVENTGTAVDLATAEQWFRPFESTTSEVDPILGHGMGLGLTIVRSTLGDYGGSVSFVPPRPGFATAVQVRIPR